MMWFKKKDEVFGLYDEIIYVENEVEKMPDLKSKKEVLDYIGIYFNLLKKNSICEATYIMMKYKIIEKAGFDYEEDLGKYILYFKKGYFSIKNKKEIL